MNEPKIPLKSINLNRITLQSSSKSFKLYSKITIRTKLFCWLSLNFLYFIFQTQKKKKKTKNKITQNNTKLS